MANVKTLFFFRRNENRFIGWLQLFQVFEAEKRLKYKRTSKKAWKNDFVVHVKDRKESNWNIFFSRSSCCSVHSITFHLTSSVSLNAITNDAFIHNFEIESYQIERKSKMKMVHNSKFVSEYCIADVKHYPYFVSI